MTAKRSEKRDARDLQKAYAGLGYCQALQLVRDNGLDGACEVLDARRAKKEVAS